MISIIPKAEDMQETSPTTDQLALRRITSQTRVQPHEFLYQWQGKPCFARGELVALTGKAKSGKTYVCSLLMALAERSSIMGFLRPQEAPYRVLWIDTEQSEDSTWEILTHRIATLIGKEPDEEQFAVYNFRQEEWQNRLNLVTTAIVCHQPDLVIFDGIRDVVGDINDYEQAQDVLTKLLSIASWSKACIVCVLHQNKAPEDKTLRGALGTELQNKSFETYECQKDPDNRQMVMRQTATRKYDITGKLTFTVDENGLPQPAIFSDETREKRKIDFNPDFMGPYGRIDQPKIFRYILPFGKRMTTAQLRAVLMKVGNINSFNFAGSLIEEAKASGVIREIKKDDVSYYEYSDPQMDFEGTPGPFSTVSPPI